MENGQALLAVVPVLVCLKTEVHLHSLCSVPSPFPRFNAHKREMQWSCLEEIVRAAGVFGRELW